MRISRRFTFSNRGFIFVSRGNTFGSSRLDVYVKHFWASVSRETLNKVYCVRMVKKGVPVGLFDGLKRGQKAAETVKQHKKRRDREDELIIDHIEVVERETVKSLWQSKKFLLLPIKMIKDKAPVKHGRSGQR